MNFIYSQENMETPWFAEVVEDLLEQVNTWIED